VRFGGAGGDQLAGNHRVERRELAGLAPVVAHEATP
jgi:hypothetical protein